MDEDSMIDNVGSETVPLDGMKMNVEEPIVVLGIEDKARQLEESVEVGDEEDPEEEVKNDGNSKEEVNIEEHNEEDPEEEVKNDGNSKEEVNIEEHNEEDPEEEVRNDENRYEELIIEEVNEADPEEEVSNDENPKEEVSIEENNEEDPEEEVRNDENQKEELIIEENYEDGPEEAVKNEEDATNNPRSEGKIEAISKKMSKLRKKPKMLKKNIALRKKVKNALVSKSKLDEHQWVGKVDTEMITLPMLAKNYIPNDVGTVVVTSEQTDIVDYVDNGVLNMNAVVLGEEEKKEYVIGELNNEENTKEELQNEGDARNEAKAKEKLEANSKKKANKKLGKKKKYLRGKNGVVVNNGENPESSKKKTTTKENCMGMIFMCNSKTKMDCYHYQVLGLPASKRDIVFEIYEGMKLFLFDIDLKLIYGIYEAAGPGGYNIEPKAFNSAFPSQVRFAVLEDCLPLAEEKFKKIIKDNYYSKKKFDCQLNSKQVENLCELFRVACKGSTYKELNGSRNAEGPPFVDHGLKPPPRGRKAKGPQAEAPAFVEHESKRLRRRRKAESQRAEAPPFVDHGPKQPPGGRKAKGRQAKAPAFVERESKRPRRRRKVESQRAEAPIPVDHEPKQPRGNKKRKIPRAEAPIDLDRKLKRSCGSRKAEACPFVDPKPKRLRRSQGEETQNFLYGDSRHPAWEDERHCTLARDHLYLEDHVAYRREVYEPPLEHPPPRQLLHLSLASSHIPSSERDVYRRDELHYRVVRPLGVDLRRQDEFDYHDDFNHSGSYLTYRGHSSYRYLSSSAAQPSEYYRPASGRPASTYHLSAAPPADFQPHRSGYQYYP